MRPFITFMVVQARSLDSANSARDDIKVGVGPRILRSTLWVRIMSAGDGKMGVGGGNFVSQWRCGSSNLSIWA